MLTRRHTIGAGIAVLLAAAGAAALVFARFAEPAEPDETFRAALRALERGDLDGVAVAAQTLESDQHQAAHVRLLDGAIFLREGRFQEALAQFAPIEPEGELREPLLLLTGECLYRLGRLPEAETVLRKLVSADPAQAAARRWLGAIYYDLGAWDAARVELSELIRLVPDDPAPHRLMGLMYQDFEQYEPAIEQYRRALELSPPVPMRRELLRELARCLIAQRAYPAALDCLREADADANVLAMRAECYWSLGRAAEARDCLERAGSEGGANRSVALLTASIAIDEGRPRDALPPLEQALEHDPHDIECRYQFALAWRQSGDAARADAEMARWKESATLRERLTSLNEQAVADPRDPVVREQLAEVCAQLGKDKLAAVWRHSARACREAQRLPAGGR